MKNTQIRPSQFITTYGVGSIIDGPQGSCMILDIEKSGLFHGGEAPPNIFKISIVGASRLSKRIAYDKDDYDPKKIGI